VDKAETETNKISSIEGYIEIIIKKVMDFAKIAGNDRLLDQRVSAANFLESVRLPTLEAPLGKGHVFKRLFQAMGTFPEKNNGFVFV
jgi:hypothetical protein